jgi:hypothetical protein
MWRNPHDSRVCLGIICVCRVLCVLELLWLKLADHSQDVDGELLGPLFGQLTDKGRTNLTMKNQSMCKASKKDYVVKVRESTSPYVANWGTQEGELVNLTDWHVGSILRSVIKGAKKFAESRMEHDSAMKEAWRRLQRATPHSFRVGLVAWAVSGMAGGDGAHVQARLGGRWQITSEILTCTGVVVRPNGISTGVVTTPFTKGYRGPSTGLPGVATQQGGLRFDV